MKHRDSSWQTKEGITLYSQSWEPDSQPKGVVCLVHGLGEHSGRYAHLGQFLNQAGYVLSSFDLRGHGKSQGQRGHSSSFESYLRDIDRLLDEASRRFPELPRFLYGHSLGGVLVLNYVLRRKPELAGVIATGAGLRTALEKQTIKITFAHLLGPILPNLSLPSGLDPSNISHDPDIVNAYTRDPLVHNRATLGMAKNTLQAIPWTFEHASEFQIPLLLMHGGSDPLAFPEGSQEFARSVLCDCTLKIWPGLYHEIHNEPEQKQVFSFLRTWLDERCH